MIILGKRPSGGLDDTTLTTQKKKSINFTEQQKKFCLSLHYNEGNCYIFVLKYKNSKQMILEQMQLHYQKIFQLIM